MVVPIRCQDLNIDETLLGMPTVRSTFQMKYPVLPLSVWQVKRDEFQPLENKMGGKLVTSDGKNTNMADRGTLVKSILTSQAIFHLTTFSIPWLPE
jgi:hypothetical protein